MADLLVYLADKDFVSFDTETTGVDKESEIIGFSIAAELDVGYYVLLSYWDVAQQKLVYLPETNQAAKAVLSLLATKSLVMHNGIFDCSMVENNFKISLIEALHTDTMILAHLLNENRSVGLKELGEDLFGEDARKEQTEMRESVYKNGGVLTKEKYELYKADGDLMARYGAKDAILTLKLFYAFVPELYEQKLDKFFYDEESMPLLRGPTYDLNTTGLRVDPDKLQKLRCELETECLELKSYIYKEVTPYVKEKYPGTGKTNHFNIGSSKQLAWLLFDQLGNEFHLLTKEGKKLCKALQLRLPYAVKDKKTFARVVMESHGQIWEESKFNKKTGKMSRPKKVGDYWNYLGCGKEALGKYSAKYKWVKSLLEYSKALKILNTYVIGIQGKMKYNVIRPSFLQHGTTSGRYSSKNPNFQNLPRDDKRVKACIVARPGKVFVGADYSQLEPRIFASTSGDETLMGSFARKEDFYSVVGAPVYGVTGVSLFKNDENSFAKKYPALRDKSKVFSLATPYGRTAGHQAGAMNISLDEAKDLINKYFAAYPKVELMMLESHEMAKRDGVVYNLYGRPRRIPAAKNIINMYGDVSHGELPYEARTLLNLAMNHRVQSTGASIMNRAAIGVKRALIAKGWPDTKIILQVHDEIILEVPKQYEDEARTLLKDCMENAAELPGVKLEAEPKIANDLAALK